MSESQHPATPARLQRARQEGDVPKSQELAVAVQMLGMLVVAMLTIGGIANWLRQSTLEQWSGQTMVSTSPDAVTDLLRQWIGGGVLAVLPLLGLLFLIGFVSHWMQTGLLFYPEKAAPDLTRLGGSRWLRRLFSLSSLSLLLVGAPKALITVVVLVLSIYSQQRQFYALSNLPINALAWELFQLLLAVGFHVGVTLLLLAGFDYGLNWLTFRRRLRMSDQEVRDEIKSQSGNTMVRHNRR